MEIYLRQTRGQFHFQIFILQKIKISIMRYREIAQELFSHAVKSRCFIAQIDSTSPRYGLTRATCCSTLSWINSDAGSGREK